MGIFVNWALEGSIIRRKRLAKNLKIDGKNSNFRNPVIWITIRIANPDDPDF